MLGQSHTRPHTIILLGWPYKTRLLLFNIMQVAQPMHNPYALSIVLSIQKPGKEKLPSNRAEEGVWNATRILPLDYVFFVSYLSLYYIVHYNKSISFSLFLSFFSLSSLHHKWKPSTSHVIVSRASLQILMSRILKRYHIVMSNAFSRR